MRSYELVLVLKPSLTGVVRKKVLDAIKDDLKVLKLKEEKEIGEKTLSYKIKKETKGYFLDLWFESESVPEGFEKKLLNNDRVLRHLLIRKK